VQEEESQRWRDWEGVDGEKQGAGSRDQVKNIEGNSRLFVRRMMHVDERE